MKNLLNLSTNLVAFFVTFSISFFLSPYIVRTLGVEAKGLIGLSTSFLGYASILTMTLSSMASRFITIQLRTGNDLAANEYYTAAYANNLIGAFAIIPIMLLTVINFGNWFNVPKHLVHDGATLSALMFLHFLLPMLVPRWKVGTWATNNLYLDSFRTMQSVALRGGVILTLFILFKPSVIFVGLATLIAGIFDLAFSGYYKHRFLPRLKVHFRYLQWSKVLELLSAGIWNSLNYIGTFLNTGFHLLLANLFVGATRMGLLSLAMTVPGMANQLALNLTSIFSPNLAFAYAEKNFTAMQQQIKRAMNIVSLLFMTPIAALIVFGQAFFNLWIPGEDSSYLYLLSIGVGAGIVLTGTTSPLQNIFVITNSLRKHSIASTIMGILNVALAVLLLNTTNLGVLAILISSAATASLRVLIFTIPMSSRRIQDSPWTTYKELIRALGYLIILCCLGAIISSIAPATNWTIFLLDVSVMSVLGLTLNLLVFASRGDRTLALETARKVGHRLRP